MSQNQNQSNTYTITVNCSNCGYHGTVQIPKGTVVSAQACPHCGCRTLSNHSFKPNEPTLRDNNIWPCCDPVDKALRPSKFPWLNTWYSSIDDKDKSHDITLSYSNDNGKEKSALKVNGKTVAAQNTNLDKFIDTLLEEFK